MTLQSTPAWARVLSTPEITDRNVLRAAFGGRSGAIRPGDFGITPNATTRKIDVAAGRAFILGQENASQGGYVAWNDALETLTLAAPAASPVIDSLIMRIWDEQYGTLSSGTSRAEWAIVRGTPNASPVAITDASLLSAGANYVPGAWWRVADIRTNPGDTTVPSGQIYPTLTHARQGGYTWGNSVLSTTGFGGAPSDAVKGDSYYELDTNLERIYDGTNWRYVPVTLGGTQWTGTGNFVTGLGSTETVFATAAAVTIPPNTMIRMHSSWFVLGSASNDTFQFLMRDTNVSGTQRGGTTWTNQNSLFGYFVTLDGWYETGSVAEVKTFCVTGSRVGGSGTVSVIAGGTAHDGSLTVAITAPKTGVVTHTSTP
jgi:hypothetical protein